MIYSDSLNYLYVYKVKGGITISLLNDKKTAFWILIAAVIAAVLAGLFFMDHPPDVPSVSQAVEEEPDVISLVEKFGDALKKVSLLAPDDVVAKEIKENYSDFVTPELLAKWQSDPQSAPGRMLSSPWPDRIDVKSVEADGNGGYVVSGEIIEVTSTELQNSGAAAKKQVTLGIVRKENRWLISSVEAVKQYE
ncbi:conserved protein of unknown function [Ruminococcaceae bacterium BL-6]|nr:conserved protein of unknown function [Ruminococcaceae bacterium BL-6]